MWYVKATIPTWAWSKQPQVAAAKGLVVGAFSVTKRGRSVVNYAMEPNVVHSSLPRKLITD